MDSDGFWWFAHGENCHRFWWILIDLNGFRWGFDGFWWGGFLRGRILMVPGSAANLCGLSIWDHWSKTEWPYPSWPLRRDWARVFGCPPRGKSLIVTSHTAFVTSRWVCCTASMFRLPDFITSIRWKTGLGCSGSRAAEGHRLSHRLLHMWHQSVCSTATVFRCHHFITCIRWKTEPGCSGFCPAEGYRLLAQRSRRIHIIPEPIHCDPKPGGKKTADVIL